MKRTAKKSPTSRSLDLLRGQGWTVAVVEKFNRFSTRRIDLFGCIDILGICPQLGFIGIQATTSSNRAARVAKIKDEPRARTFLEAGGRIFVHGWSKKGPRGKRKVWQVLKTEILKEDFQIGDLKC